MNSHQPAAPRRRLIFIAGWGRSGSTVMANVLGSVAGAASLGEVRYFWDRGLLENRRCGCGSGVRDCAFWSAVVRRAGIGTDESLARRMLDSVGAAAVYRQLGALAGGRIGGYRKRRATELDTLRRLYAAAFEEAGVDTLIDASKTPPYAINLLTEAGFEVYVLHLVRDPRAVAWSWSRRKSTEESDRAAWFPRYSAVRSAFYWLLFNALGMRLGREPGSRYLRVRYEDFCEDPERTVARILRFCRMGSRHPRWSAPGTIELRPQHSVSGNPARFRTGSIVIEPDEEWRTRMPRLARLAVTLICAPLMWRCGYTRGHKLPAPLPQFARLETPKDATGRWATDTMTE